MTKRELQGKIDDYVDHMYPGNTPQDPMLCVNMRRVFKLLVDEMFRLHETEGKK